VHWSSHIEQLKTLLPQCLLPDQVRIGTRLARALTRSQCGADAPAPLARWLAEAHSSVQVRRQRAGVLRHLRYPAELPITMWKDAIVAAIRAHPVVVVAGETGSGKTTQLPKMCLEAGLGLRARIGCTQPRRVAALSISRRLAEELQVTWGDEVGCKIRFTDHSRLETSVKVMTDGILLAEIRNDPFISEYEAIILDEAHERSLNIDFLLGYLRLLLHRRDDLKLIITSATIDTELFSRAFNNAPIIEVSGRLYPVEVRYCPFDEQAEEEGEVTYIDAAVNAVDGLLQESASGDILVFMPGERDIRETCDLLQTRHKEELDVLPLFGRLTVAEQQRVFAPGPLRRVVVATNIAETSLTVPRIRYVVDTGLARISRYHPGTRSNRLPVEPISQSSASQRKGRCGRVADGVCLRLFAEADFQARRAYTEPEIQRCDLADVILRLKAFGLGEIETFPFLDPPSPPAIHGAYQLLQELGALDEQRQLTELGRDLAQLPVDPAIGRMILEAHREDALSEVLVIAAGLSIQDPRDRPLEQRATAEAAHQRFQHPQSDFLALLNIWNAYHDTWESLKTQNQLRKFCKANFLSFTRMREWVDLHAQLKEAVEDVELGSRRHAETRTSRTETRRPKFELGPSPRASARANYAAIHRSILTGLCGHVARRDERNVYRLVGNKQAMIFPGSGLCAKGFAGSGGRETEAGLPTPSHQSGQGKQSPRWIVAGEILQTSRLFVRTVAAIEPEWIIELAPHLVRYAYDSPHWDGETGRVLCTERVTLHGLVLRETQVDYAEVNPADATAIFIRSALVEEGILNRADSQPAQRAERGSAPETLYRFLEHNRQIREKVEMWQTRLPHRVVPDLNEALFEFYSRHIHNMSSIRGLDLLLKSNRDPNFLCVTEADLLGDHAKEFNTAVFPDVLLVAGQPMPVSYAYAPGDERDGVTMRLTVPLAEMVDAEQLEWLVPALREERMAQLLRLLPKALRRQLAPLHEAARRIVSAIDPRSESFLMATSQFIRQSYGVDIPVSAWPVKELPSHLRPRFEIVSKAGKMLGAGRDLRELRQRIHQHDTPEEVMAWQQAAQRWERYGLSAWDLGDLPERYLVTDVSGFPVWAYPGLHVEHGEVNLRLFRKPEEARQAGREAAPRLAERVLHRELGWLQKDLCALAKFSMLHVTLGPVDELLQTAFENIRRHLFPEPELPPRTAQGFADYVERARKELPGLAPRFVEWVGAILQKRQEALMCRRPLPNMRAEIDGLAPPQFLLRIPFAQLGHVPRYLQALLVRTERAALNPAKDAEKARRVQPYLEASRGLCAKPGAQRTAQMQRFLWLIEEFKVSCFAQELGTAVPVSTKKLDEALAEARQAVSPPTPAKASATLCKAA
jgi:ATP-dependent helicase HrpA